MNGDEEVETNGDEEGETNGGRSADGSDPAGGSDSTDGDDPVDEGEPVDVRVRDREGSESTVEVEPGTVLRDALRDAGFDVYGSVSGRINCGGCGICGTCGVRVDPPPEPEHFHDAAAARFGYPRLSCRIVVETPMTVELVEKRMWGQLLPRRSNDA